MGSERLLVSAASQSGKRSAFLRSGFRWGLIRCYPTAFQSGDGWSSKLSSQGSHEKKPPRINVWRASSAAFQSGNRLIVHPPGPQFRVAISRKNDEKIGFGGQRSIQLSYPSTDLIAVFIPQASSHDQLFVGGSGCVRHHKHDCRGGKRHPMHPSNSGLPLVRHTGPIHSSCQQGALPLPGLRVISATSAGTPIRTGKPAHRPAPLVT